MALEPQWPLLLCVVPSPLLPQLLSPEVFSAPREHRGPSSIIIGVRLYAVANSILSHSHPPPAHDLTLSHPPLRIDTGVVIQSYSNTKDDMMHLVQSCSCIHCFPRGHCY
ncbi:hypothetical protein LY76DRAFT_343290 [Colletotrichum caudatum]|nr:hypothetical protein LY76DRAFT_343290 [Colletotrichum caudatum]